MTYSSINKKATGNARINRTARGSQRAKILMRSMVKKLRDGCWKAGEALPSENALAEEAGISRSAVHKVLVELEAQHLVYQVRGVGTFAGSPGIIEKKKGTCLFIYPDNELRLNYIMARMGFESKLASSELSSLTLPYSRAIDLYRSGNMPTLRGVFAIASFNQEKSKTIKELISPETHLIKLWRDHSDTNLDADGISFDNRDGGRQAAVHLLEHGHTKIAFMGLHSSNGGNKFPWSTERARGYAEALHAAGVPLDDAIILPSPAMLEKYLEHQEQIGYLLAETIVAEDSPFTALICGNDMLASGAVKRLRNSGLSREKIPSIVGFDDSDLAASMGLSSLHLPWHKLGALAAETIIERMTGQLNGPFILRRTRMEFINRLASNDSSVILPDKVIGLTAFDCVAGDY